MFALVGERYQGPGAAHNAVGPVGQDGPETELAPLFGGLGVYGERFSGIEFGF